MNKMYKRLVLKNRVTLAENGDFRYFRDHLIQEEVLSFHEVDIIEAEKTTKAKISRFLDILHRKPEGIVQTCIQVIKKEDRILYDQLVWPAPVSSVPMEHSGRDSELCSSDHNQESSSDPLMLIQKELEDWYKHTLSRLHPIPWCEWLELDLDHVFTNLEVMPARKHQLGTRATPKSAEVEINLNEATEVKTVEDSENNAIGLTSEAETMEQLSELLKTTSGRAISFVEGPAGIGKSTLCRRLVHLWAKHNHQIGGRHFDLVFILEARTLLGDVKSCIASQLFSEDFSLNADSIYECIRKREENCLLIVDGVDELSEEGKSMVLKLLSGSVLRHAHILLTGRPESAREFVKFANIHMVLKGFTYSNVEAYICKYFNSAQSQPKEKLLNRIRNDFQLQKLTVSPFTTLLLCLLVEDNLGKIPSSYNDILHQVVLSTCKHYICRLKGSHVQETLDEDRLFYAAGQLAYAGFHTGKFVFLENEVCTTCSSDLAQHLLSSGLLNRDFTLSRLHTRGYCYFPHKTIQEYLCAWYLAGLNVEDLQEKLGPLTLEYRLDINMYRYLLNMLVTKETKFTVVLRSLFTKAERSRFPSVITSVELLRWTLLLLVNIETNVNVLDLSAEAISQSESLNRAFCYGSFYKYWAGRLEECARLVLQKMSLRPVAVVVHDRRLARGIGERCGKDVCHFVKRDVELPVTAAVQFPHLREMLVSSVDADCLLEGSPGLPWTCVHCKSVQAAIALLKKKLAIHVLSITLIPGVFTFDELKELAASFKHSETKLTVAVIFPEHPYDDNLYLKIIGLLSSSQSSILSIRYWSYKPYSSIVYPKDQNPLGTAGKYDLDMLYVFPSSVHKMCFNKCCPF